MIGQTIILVVALGVLGIWLSRHLALSQNRRTQTILRAADATPPPEPPPKVSIIVPAKDEAANITACLDTLLAQDYPNFEIIVVDDRSTDGTAAIVGGLAERDARVRLVQVTELPRGWFGKAHAMVAGAGQATGEWLLFVDADCRQARLSLRVALAHALAEGGDMLSLWPQLTMASFAENLVQPLCASILALYFRPHWVNDPRRRTAFANGQFILIRHNVYDAVGGYESVRSKALEDIHLAGVVKGRGYRLLNAMGFELFSTRMYNDFHGIWRGWTRIFSGAFRSPWVLVPLVILLLLFSGSPFVLAPAAGVAAAEAGWADGMRNALLAVGLAQLAAMGTVLWRLNRLMGARQAYLALYPVSVLIVFGILLKALIIGLGLGRVRWRGTTYRQDAA